jgi:hypothetical protein
MELNDKEIEEILDSDLPNSTKVKLIKQLEEKKEEEQVLCEEQKNV